MDFFRKLFGDYRVLTQMRPEARSEYERRIALKPLHETLEAPAIED